MTDSESVIPVTGARAVIAVFFVVMGLGVAGAVAQQPAVTLEIITTSGQYAPETGGAFFQNFETVCANLNGDIVFSATLYPGVAGVDDTNHRGIWRQRQGGSLEKVARTGDLTSPYDQWGSHINEEPPDPEDGPVIFASLGEPVLGPGGNVAYTSRLVRNEDTVRDWQDGALWLAGHETITRPAQGTSVLSWMVARIGNPSKWTVDESGEQVTRLNGDDFYYRELDEPVIGTDGTVAFTAMTNDWREVSPGEWEEFRMRGLWRYPRPEAGGDFDPVTDMSFPDYVVTQESEGPGVPGSQMEEIAGAMPGSGGKARFLGALMAGEGGVTDETRDGLWESEAGELAALARAGESAPGASANFYRFGAPGLNEKGQASFWASLLSSASPSLPPSNREGIFLHRFGQVEPLALEGESAPGCAPGTVFDFLYDPVVNEDGVSAFLAYVRGAGVDVANEKGIWAGGRSGSLRLVVRAGDEPPSAPGVRFRGFSFPRINRMGQVAFVGSLAHGEGGVTEAYDRGCWATTQNGELVPVIGEGQWILLGPSDYRIVSEFEITDFTDRGEIYVRVVFTDTAEAIFKATLPAPTMEGYDDWATQAIPNPADRLFAADPDLDGVSNLLEFAFGHDPDSPDSSDMPRTSVVTVAGPVQSSRMVEVVFEKRIDESEVSYEVQVSDDMTTWTPATQVVDARPMGHGMEEVTVRDTVPVSEMRPRFFRVVAIQND